MKWKTQKWPVSKIKPWAKNPRTIGGKKLEDLGKSMDRFGYVEPIIVNTTGELIGGHARLLKLKEVGRKSVSVRVPDKKLTKKQAEELAIRLNKNIAGEWDMEALKDFNMDSLIEWGFDPDELPDFGDDAGGKDPEAPFIVPKKAKTKPGDLYKLGEHRLFCGDSRSLSDIQRLMGGERADMVFTDPPYGVDYEGKTKEKLKIENDAMDEKSLDTFIKATFDAMDTILKDGAYCLATVPAGPLHLNFALDWKKREWLRQVLVWNKDSMVLGHSEYHYKHEPILFGWKPGKRLKCSDRCKTTVWDFPRPKVSAEHPTMKPVDMWKFGINNHSKRNDIIYEPFGGSGTCIIACEELSRKCRMMEIDPIYIDVIVSRYCDYIGDYNIIKNGKQEVWQNQKK